MTTVVVRVRPRNDREKLAGHASCLSLNQVSVQLPNNWRSTHDRVYGPESRNKDVYEDSVEPIVEQFCEGVNATILAYGSTGSGKSHTIHGPAVDAGIVPHAVDTIFKHIRRNEGMEFTLSVSFYEIYNEEVVDLHTREKLAVRSTGIVGLTEQRVSTAIDIYSFINRGYKHRHVNRTNYNDTSSRSHAVIRFVIESASLEGTTQSELTIVDLAGSENAKKSGSEDRMHEAKYINKSLTTLCRVIEARCSHKANAFVPYRDSVLTMAMQKCLGGNAQVYLICCVAPTDVDLGEIQATLRFAQRAKKMRNDPHANVVADEKDTMLRRYKDEIERLKSQLQRRQEVGLTKRMQQLMRLIISSKSQTMNEYDFTSISPDESAREDQLQDIHEELARWREMGETFMITLHQWATEMLRRESINTT